MVSFVLIFQTTLIIPFNVRVSRGTQSDVLTTSQCFHTNNVTGSDANR